MRFFGVSMVDVLDVDILGFSSICDSMERIKARERLELFQTIGLAFGGGEEAKKFQQEQIRIFQDSDTSDLAAFIRRVGKGF